MVSPPVQVGCLAVGIDAQAASLEFERAARATERLEAFSTPRALKAALETMFAKDGEVCAARATQVASEAKSLADVATAQAETFAIRAEAEEAVTAA